MYVDNEFCLKVEKITRPYHKHKRNKDAITDQRMLDQSYETFIKRQIDRSVDFVDFAFMN